jgi:hypothetical protein
MGRIFQILSLVKAAVHKESRWLTTEVEGFPFISRDERWSYARHIAIMLVEGKCNCGRENCAAQHDLSQWDPQERTLLSFIYRAVIGPAGLQANSIQQGMLYPLLHEDYGLSVVKVGFKLCPADACTREARKYEGTTCPYCGRPFDPATIPVLALDWLVIEGVYVAGQRWWACGIGRKAHYYRQQQCEDPLTDNPHTYPKPSYHVQHGTDGHDRCPLANCSASGQRHPLRGTTLWIRAKFAEVKQSFAPLQLPFVLSLIEGMEE